MDDLELKDLEKFIGTENYYTLRPFNEKATDGVKYIMDNGYSWLVTDALSIIDAKFKKEDFLTINLKLLKDSKAEMEITNGNGKVLYKKKYGFTTAKRELALFVENGIVLLDSEY